MNVKYPPSIAKEDAELAKQMLDVMWRETHCLHQSETDRIKFLQMSVGASIVDILTYLQNQSFTLISA